MEINNSKENKKIVNLNIIKVPKTSNFTTNNKGKYYQYILSLKILSIFILHILVIYYYIYNKNSFIFFKTRKKIFFLYGKKLIENYG